MTARVRAIGYVRVSTGDQGESGLGLKAQVAAIHVACDLRGWELVAVREEVKSGARADNRPVLSEVMQSLRAGEADAVVVAKLDRLSRSVVDAGRLLEEARKGGFNIVALDLGLDLSTPTGELVANVLAAVAQWERRMIGVRTSEALQVKIAGGWKSPSWEERVPRVVRRRMLRMAKAGKSQREITNQVNADGVPAVGGCWHRGTVIRVLRQMAAWKKDEARRAGRGSCVWGGARARRVERASGRDDTLAQGADCRSFLSAFACQTWRVTRSHLQLRAKPGQRDALLEALDRLEVFAAVREQPGFLAAQVLVPEDDADAVLVEGSWSSPEHYDRWYASSARTEMLRDVHHPEARVYHMVDAIS